MKNLEAPEIYFVDALLLKAFAMKHQQEYIAFVEQYLEEQEIESKLKWERENDEE